MGPSHAGMTDTMLGAPRVSWGATVSSRPQSHSTDIQLEFAATDIPLTVTSRDFATPEQALAWVRDKGLIVEGRNAWRRSRCGLGGVDKRNLP